MLVRVKTLHICVMELTEFGTEWKKQSWNFNWDISFDIVPKHLFGLRTGVSREFSRAQYSQSKSNPGLSGLDGLLAPSVDITHVPCDPPLWLYQEPFESKKERKNGKKNGWCKKSADNTNHATVHILHTGNFCILCRSMETLCRGYTCLCLNCKPFYVLTLEGLRTTITILTQVMLVNHHFIILLFFSPLFHHCVTCHNFSVRSRYRILSGNYQYDPSPQRIKLNYYMFSLLEEIGFLTSGNSPLSLAKQLSSTNSFTFFSICLTFSSGLLFRQANMYILLTSVTNSVLLKKVERVMEQTVHINFL